MLKTYIKEAWFYIVLEIAALLGLALFIEYRIPWLALTAIVLAVCDGCGVFKKLNCLFKKIHR